MYQVKRSKRGNFSLFVDNSHLPAVARTASVCFNGSITSFVVIQFRHAADGSGIDAHHPLQRKPLQVMRPVGLGASANGLRRRTAGLSTTALIWLRFRLPT